MIETKIWLEFDDPRSVKQSDKTTESLHQITKRLTSDYNAFLGRLGLDQKVWWYKHNGRECWAIGNDYGFCETNPKSAGQYFNVNYLAKGE